jgi:hypothetical protein
MDSPLLIVQKIDTLEMFLLPTLDFMMLNGDVGEKQLKKMDQRIRDSINRLLKTRGLPVECHHASWRDGGLSYPSLVDRRKVLMIRSFTQMMLSKDEKIREAMRWFAEKEREYRCIGEDPESPFLNWATEHGHKGTASLAARTRKTCSKMNVTLKLTRDELILKTTESELKTKTAVGIGRFLTQKVIRAEKIEKLMSHQVHGASYTTLKGNEPSNAMLTNIYTHRSDAFFRFVVVGRADCLPTPVNLQRWFGDRGDDNCRRCGRDRKPTLAHILNECTPNFTLMTTRHNRLAEVIRRAIIEFVGRDLRSELMENVQAEEERLPAELRQLRPDMIFERRKDDQMERRRRRRGPRQGQRQGQGQEEERERDEVRAEAEVEQEEARMMERQDGRKMMEILEFSCPYGYISHGRNSLERVYEQKKQKYAELANELRRLRNEEIRVTAVIVSSMKAVYGPSLKDLQKVLGCSDREMRKLGRKMSETVILGSMEIWRQNAREIERGREEAANQMIQEEADQLERPEVIADIAAEVEVEIEVEDEDGDDDREDRRGSILDEIEAEAEAEGDASAEEVNAEPEAEAEAEAESEAGSRGDAGAEEVNADPEAVMEIDPNEAATIEERRGEEENGIEIEIEIEEGTGGIRQQFEGEDEGLADDEAEGDGDGDEDF